MFVVEADVSVATLSDAPIWLTRPMDEIDVDETLGSN